MKLKLLPFSRRNITHFHVALRLALELYYTLGNISTVPLIEYIAANPPQSPLHYMTKLRTTVAATKSYREAEISPHCNPRHRLQQCGTQY